MVEGRVQAGAALGRAPASLPCSEDVWVAVDARPLHRILAVCRLLQVQRQAVVLHLQGVHLLLEPLHHLAQLRSLGLLAAAARGDEGRQRGQGKRVQQQNAQLCAAMAGAWPSKLAAQEGQASKAGEAGEAGKEGRPGQAWHAPQLLHAAVLDGHRPLQ